LISCEHNSNAWANQGLTMTANAATSVNVFYNSVNKGTACGVKVFVVMQKI
jgi:hypothetical protein